MSAGAGDGLLSTRRIRLRQADIRVRSRTDQPGDQLDRELQLLSRALLDPPAEPCVEVPAWDAALAVGAMQAGGPGSGTLVPLNRGAAASIALGLDGAPTWEIAPPDELRQMHTSAVVRAPFWLGRAGVEWCLRVAAGALQPGGRLYLLGAKNRGIDSLRRMGEIIVGPVLDRTVGEHRRLYVFERDTREAPAQEFGWMATATLAGRSLQVHHHPVLFSPGRVDPATALLAEHLPGRAGRWLDLGCGSGVLATVAAANREREVWAIDWADAAVAATGRTLAANGARGSAVLADGIPPEVGPFDVIVCYPPFHVGAKVEHGPAMRLLDAAAGALAAEGELWVVLASAQSATRILEPRFEHVRLVAESGGVRVFACHRGRRPAGVGVGRRR
jgi:16S rRNA (guanine1207-N2)-methyltransferase